MEVFNSNTKEINHLKKNDKKLGSAIERIGPLERPVCTDVFKALIKNIVDQQISRKAAETVWNRFCSRFTELSPGTLEQAALDDIQACGMSFRKAGYIKGIAGAAVSGAVDFAQLHDLTDEEIIQQLTSLHGVGTWTAEMILIFSLARPDVVSWGDLAIRRGMMNLYGLSEITREKFMGYRKRYTPYGSTASLYLWHLSSTPVT